MTHSIFGNLDLEKFNIGIYIYIYLYLSSGIRYVDKKSLVLELFFDIHLIFTKNK